MVFLYKKPSPLPFNYLSFTLIGFSGGLSVDVCDSMCLDGVAVTFAGVSRSDCDT